MTIAYLDSRKMEGKFIGGLLSVDERGIPVEFKYTDPVVPNELQKILYGSSIDTYLKGELIAKTLLKKMEKKPDFVFVHDPELLEVDDRLLLIAERTEKLETPTRVSEEEVLLPFKGSSVKIVGKVSDEDMKKLADLLETFDVMEPFQRLERALEYLCSEK
ncbi:MAG: hypothetical protein PWQ21_310 [Thermotoga sp.]|jgi:hypothetical protein|nr:hypothetical protein [Thermotoga sp.]